MERDRRVMSAERNVRRNGTNRRKLVYTAAFAFLCLAAPTTEAYAQAADATGTVTCKEAYPDGTTASKVYAVAFTFSGGTAVGRWGAGKDVAYDFGSVVGSVPRNFTAYIYFVSDPNNTATYEQLYSEAGSLVFKVGKNNVMTITGKSLAVVDYPFDTTYVNLSADCTWSLSGTCPASLCP